MTFEQTNYFLKQVYKYYPVGFAAVRKWYDGHLEMKRIVANKVDHECNDPNSISNLFVSRLQQAFPLFKVENRNYIMFPNYLVSIPLLSVNEGRIRTESTFEICISLLCDYYTYFVYDFYSLTSLYREGNLNALAVASFDESVNTGGFL